MRKARVSLVFLLFACMIGGDAYAVREIVWTVKASMSLPRWTSAVAIGGTVYYCSGWGCGPYVQRSEVEAYSIATNTWYPRAGKPIARGALGIAAIGTRIYAWGGNTGLNCLSENEEYDAVANTWTGKASTPTPVNFPSGVSLNGKAYSFGGSGGTPLCNIFPTVMEYDPGGNTWSYKADMSAAKICVAPVAWRGLIYIFGGGPDAWNPVATVEVYDPGSNTWSSRSNMPQPLFDAATVAGDDRIYLVGSYTCPTCVYEYNPSDDTWVTCTPLNIGRRGSIAVWCGGKIYAVGGECSGSVEEGYLVPPPFVLRARKGEMVVAPNKYAHKSGKRGVDIALTGEGGKTVEARIYDATGGQIALYRIAMDALGEGRILFDCRDKNGEFLAPGLYWIVAKGAGVDDKKGFAVVRGK